MKLHELAAWQLSEKLQAREISAREVVSACFDRLDEVEDRLKALVLTTREQAEQTATAVDEARAAGQSLAPVAGLPIAYKDMLCTKGIKTTCCSRMLENFVPPYTATVVERCEAAGLPMIGKTNMDEFAMGSSTENSAFQVTANPWNLRCVPGGSSGGSAAAVAAGAAVWSLGSDTGGSIRQPAAFCGLVGLKPTYGRVSRYGAVACAPSLDQVGPLTREVRDCALLMGVIAGVDPADAVSDPAPVPDYTETLGREVKGMKAGLVRELMESEGLQPAVRQAVEQAVATLTDLGVEVEEVSLPHLNHSLACYFIIASAEASSQLARFDGVRYGHRTTRPTTDIYDMFAQSRAEGFGPEVQLRIVAGTWMLSAEHFEAYFEKAMRVRTLIKNDFQQAWQRFDLLLGPTAPTPAFPSGTKSADSQAMKLADLCTLPASLAGLPALSLPCGQTDGLPLGLQLIGRPMAEPTLLQAAYAYEQATNWHQLRPTLT